jgi:Holliday junction resolvase-like predicted endonuclease
MSGASKPYIKRVPVYPGLSSSTTGTIGELRASLDLLTKGYEIFRATSPATSCDLIAMKDGRCLRVEVRTARYAADGSPYFATTQKDRGRSDHYAAVLPDTIVYIPPLPA